MSSVEESDREIIYNYDVDSSFLLENNCEVTTFAFQPMYSEDGIDKRLRVYRLAENNSTNTSETREVGKSTYISWCQCPKCSPMESEIERKCCKGSPEIPDRKFEGGVCISEIDDFREVCLLTNVLEAALGAWHVFRGGNSDLSNKSYRFIAYKQYTCWIYGRLGKDIRRPIPSCAVQEIRRKFPAPDNVYTSYTENNLQGQ